MPTAFARTASLASALLLLWWWVHSAEAESGWIDETGRPASNTESRISKNGFGGWLVITPDRNWKQKWESSPETTPAFTTAETVERGKELFILLFFINPQTDQSGNVDVSCDLQSTRPDGSVSINQKNIPCLRGKLKGDPTWIRLAPAIIKYVGEAKDLSGKWTVRATLRDNKRRVTLPLKTSFTLK